MTLAIWRFATIFVAALALTMESAHVSVLVEIPSDRRGPA
jgi:hypothetical protein